MHDSDISELDIGQSTKKITNDNNGDNIAIIKLPYYNQTRTKHLPTRFQNMADISIFIIFKNNVSQKSFTKLWHKESNSLLEKDIFKVITISDIFNGMKIFNSRFIDKIKNNRTATAFGKSRLIIQTYKNQGKKKILTQLPIS